MIYFDPTKVSVAELMEAKEHIEGYETSFDYDAITLVCKNTAPLVLWANATLKYIEVLKNVEPLHNELQELRMKLSMDKECVIENESRLNQINAAIEHIEKVGSDKTVKFMLVDVMIASAVSKDHVELLERIFQEPDELSLSLYQKHELVAKLYASEHLT